MRRIYKSILVFLLTLFIAVPFLVTRAYALSDEPSVAINEWEMKWVEKGQEDNIPKSSNIIGEEGWLTFTFGDPLPEKPKDVQTAWLKFQLPEFNFVRPALMIHKLYANDVTIYIDNEIVYESKRNYPYNKNEILLTLTPNESNKTVIIKLNTEIDQIGLQKQMLISEYQTLAKGYMVRDILDFVLGTSLIFISLAMILSIIFLNKAYLTGWSSLSVVILSVGLMILTYSPFLHTMFSEYGVGIYYLFDIPSIIIMPAIFIFFENIFGQGPFRIVNKFRKVQVIIACVSIIWFLAAFCTEWLRETYNLVITIFFGGSVIFGNIILIGSLIVFCRQKSKEAIILLTGFGIFSIIAVIEITWYFIRDVSYDLFFWKWGMLCFIASLIIILVRRILNNYDQVVEYTKKLEIFNNELQRSEKMEIISQLAASIAHEVRNPLQVTRGFLQLLEEKSTNEKDKSFMFLAINELDRASEIITDFLTFAKPQLEQTTLLNIAEELHQIEGILIPLATIQGGVIKLEVAAELYVRGNSSKFKQALINIIKNSIEAFGEEGSIQIQAKEDSNTKEVIIRVMDNGEGMDEYDLKKLGEPFYSKKTKGTGLGLMVTYRIIEVMQGKINVTSRKGVGTEFVITLPLEKKSPIALN